MKLVSARINGLGRLVDTEIDLDQKVVAIVGPNEAGKSTLLKALAYVDSGGGIPTAERSRASSAITDATPIVRLHYRLNEDDQRQLADLLLEEMPTDFFVSRRADGTGPDFEAMPRPRKSEAPLRQLLADLDAATSGSHTIRSASIHDEDQANKRRSERAALLVQLAELHRRIDRYSGNPVDKRGPFEPIRESADNLCDLIEREFTGADQLVEILRKVGEWADQPDPGETAFEELWNRTPDAVMFSEGDRGLLSSYTLNEDLLKNTPSALRNLARLAGLDLKALAAAVEAGDIGRRDTLKAAANKQLAAIFAEAWKQSKLTVELNVERTTLRVGLLEDEVLAYQLHERSAGLRMFVAITAFLAARDTGRPTILLIDEAETHLHIDAQGDLVQMFAQQEKADKVIYTTHSPACLPADLGVGIRAVIPISGETSRVENHYWRLEGAGFTSLMVALGASAAAFTPARCAVVGEGATEMILLPTLMRKATSLDNLPYQVTPGLSEIPDEAYPDLDFQAAKVAFLVDGDKGGANLAKRIGRKVPANQIATLSVHGIENTLDATSYRDAYLTVLTGLNPSAAIGSPPALPDPLRGSWAKAMEDWARGSGLRVAGKRDVANYIIELDRIDLSATGATALQNAHQEILKALQLVDDPPAETVGVQP